MTDQSARSYAYEKAALAVGIMRLDMERAPVWLRSGKWKRADVFKVLKEIEAELVRQQEKDE